MDFGREVGDLEEAAILDVGGGHFAKNRFWLEVGNLEEVDFGSWRRSFCKKHFGWRSKIRKEVKKKFFSKRRKIGSCQISYPREGHY